MLTFYDEATRDTKLFFKGKGAISVMFYFRL